MNLGSAILMLVGFLLLLAGMISKIIGLSLFAPFITTYGTYFVGANSCILLALAVDRFHK
ncbi:MAG: hypothetical protein JSV93_03160 [Candidatus Omnitrophota bacterium]|nr:MAG: hypothetical protein JSV93_03160 [Candidatus Omnitrophota bacterium]